MFQNQIALIWHFFFTFGGPGQMETALGFSAHVVQHNSEELSVEENETQSAQEEFQEQDIQQTPNEALNSFLEKIVLF